MSRAQLPPPQGPLITHALGCLVWWPLVAMLYLVVFPSEVGVGIGITGAALLALRLTHLSWGVAEVCVQRQLRAAFSRRAAARSPGATRTAWS